MLYWHKTRTLYVEHLTRSVSPKIRFSAASARYVRRTSIYVRNTFRAHKRTASRRFGPLQQLTSTVLHRIWKKMEKHSCRNCGVTTTATSGAICRRCVDQPCYKVCKRRLPGYCFNDLRARVCQACVRKLKKPRTVRAVDDIVEHIEIPGDSSDMTFEEFIDRNKRYVNCEIDDRRRRFWSIRVVFRVFAEFSRQVDDEIQHVDSQFNLRPQLVADGHDLNFDDRRRHHTTTTCANCNSTFTHQNCKVRHHDHVTGEYLFPACNNCNLQLKPKKCKSLDGEKNTNSYFLPIIFHNLKKNYDAHFVIKHFERRFTQKAKRQKFSFDEIKVIPLNRERFLQFQIGNVKFIDSFQFMSASLDHLVSLLLKSGNENFHHTIKYMGDNDLVLQRGYILTVIWMIDPNLTKPNCHPKKIFTTHSTTNHFPTKITSELATFGIFLAYKIYASTTITMSCSMCYCWRTCLSISGTTFSKNTAWIACII